MEPGSSIISKQLFVPYYFDDAIEIQQIVTLKLRCKLPVSEEI